MDENQTKPKKKKTTIVVEEEIWEEFKSVIYRRLRVSDASTALGIVMKKWLKDEGHS